MNTICLVQTSSFLIGIKTGDIASRTTAGAVPPEGRARLADLGALLACKPGQPAPPDAPCLELHSHDETFFLVVERIEGDPEATALPATLPSACPALTARLFPQTAVCGAVAVPLLDPAQVIPVCAHLGKGIGLIAEEEPEPPEEAEAELAEPESSASIAIEEPDAAELFFAEAEEPPQMEEAEPAASASESEQDEASALDELFAPLIEEPSAPRPEEALPEPAPELESVPAAAVEETPPPAAAEEQPQPKKAAHSIDEETFKEVMHWTIARFKQSQAGAEAQLDVEHLPPDLAARVRQKGLDKNVIQYLIDQIVLRCQENVQRRRPEEQHGG